MKALYIGVAEAIISASAYNREELSTKSRDRDLVLVRQVVFYYLLENKLCTQYAAGALFRRDHATAIHGHTTVANLIATRDKKTMLIISSLIHTANEYIENRNSSVLEMPRKRHDRHSTPRHAYRNQLGNYSLFSVPRLQGYATNYYRIAKTDGPCKPK